MMFLHWHAKRSWLG